MPKLYVVIDTDTNQIALFDDQSAGTERPLIGIRAMDIRDDMKMLAEEMDLNLKIVPLTRDLLPQPKKKKEVVSTKAYIEDPGDPSVGIQSGCVTVDFGYDLFSVLAESERETVRKDLKKFFDDFLDGRVGVTFSDECSSCGKRMIEGNCLTPNCPDNSIAI